MRFFLQVLIWLKRKKWKLGVSSGLSTPIMVNLSDSSSHQAHSYYTWYTRYFTSIWHISGYDRFIHGYIPMSNEYAYLHTFLMPRTFAANISFTTVHFKSNLYKILQNSKQETWLWYDLDIFLVAWASLIWRVRSKEKLPSVMETFPWLVHTDFDAVNFFLCFEIWISLNMGQKSRSTPKKSPCYLRNIFWQQSTTGCPNNICFFKGALLLQKLSDLKNISSPSGRPLTINATD